MLLNGFFMTESRNPWPYADNVIVNLSGAQAFTERTLFTPGKYRIEIAPGGYCTTIDDDPSVPKGRGATYINIIETIREPFSVIAYCGGNANIGNIGNNPYTGTFKVNGNTSDTQSHGTDVNHIFGAGGGNCYTEGTFSNTSLRGGGNCLGNGSISVRRGQSAYTAYYGAGSCLHLMSRDWTNFETDYIRAYHVAPYAGICGGAYGGGAAGYIGSSGNNWGYRGGDSPYGSGGTTSYAQGSGIGGGGARREISPGSPIYVAGGARFDGTEWIDMPGSIDNNVTSLIRITYLEPLFS